MEQREENLSPEEQYAQLAPTLDADGFSLYAAAEEVTGLKVYEEFPYEDNHGMFEMADGHTLLRYLEAAYFGAVTWEIVPGTPYERAILGEVDKTTPEYAVKLLPADPCYFRPALPGAWIVRHRAGRACQVGQLH